MAQATRFVPRYAAWLADGLDSAANRAVANPASLGIGADLIGFGGGQPATEAYPLEAFERAFSRAILEDGRTALPYGQTQGMLPLREIVAERLARRGIQTRPRKRDHPDRLDVRACTWLAGSRLTTATRS